MTGLMQFRCGQPRLRIVPRQEYENNWDRAFGNKDAATDEHINAADLCSCRIKAINVGEGDPEKCGNCGKPFGQV